MVVYRIALTIHSQHLAASGGAARWNSRNVHVIYAAGSRALACLENVVHRKSAGLKDQFNVMLIEIPDSLKTTVIDEKGLENGWRDFDKMPITQSIGDKWVEMRLTPILIVPSAIIPGENNYVLNVNHPDFKKIKIKSIEPFIFDKRIKE